VITTDVDKMVYVFGKLMVIIDDDIDDVD